MDSFKGITFHKLLGFSLAQRLCLLPKLADGEGEMEQRECDAEMKDPKGTFSKGKPAPPKGPTDDQAPSCPMSDAKYERRSWKTIQAHSLYSALRFSWVSLVCRTIRKAYILLPSRADINHEGWGNNEDLKNILGAGQVCIKVRACTLQ